MRYRFAAIAGIALGMALSVTGCHRSSPSSDNNPTGTEQPAPPAFTPATQEELTQAHVNEGGFVPILEYHDIGPNDKKSLVRSVVHFQHDLDRLYSEGYRPIALHDYLDNRIALPLGEAPVILTFDDATPGQIRYKPDGSLDPDCALGILQAFHAAHSEFPLKATFFFWPRSGFGQPQFTAKKLQQLLALGCEIGNDTASHRSLRSMGDDQVQKDLATCVAEIHKLAPQAKVDTMAVPFGQLPGNRRLMASGKFQGTSYTNRAAMMIGAGPARSPISRKYNPMSLPRIQAIEGNLGIDYWLDKLKTEEPRYVSDGDPNTITIPKSLADKVDKKKLNGAKVRSY